MELIDIINGKYEWKLIDRVNHLKDRDIYRGNNLNAIINSYMEYRTKGLNDVIVESNFKNVALKSLTGYLSFDGSLENRFLEHLKQGYDNNLLGKNRFKAKTNALKTFDDKTIVSEEHLKLGDVVLGQCLDNNSLYKWEDRLDFLNKYLEKKPKNVNIPLLSSVEKNYLLEILTYLNSNRTLKLLEQKNDKKSLKVKNKLNDVKKSLFNYIYGNNQNVFTGSTKKSDIYLIKEIPRPQPTLRPLPIINAQSEVTSITNSGDALTRLCNNTQEKAFFLRDIYNTDRELAENSNLWNLLDRTEKPIYNPKFIFLNNFKLIYKNISRKIDSLVNPFLSAYEKVFDFPRF